MGNSQSTPRKDGKGEGGARMISKRSQDSDFHQLLPTGSPLLSLRSLILKKTQMVCEGKSTIKDEV